MTKKKFKCPVFGVVNTFSRRVLPTNGDVLKHLLCIRRKEKNGLFDCKTLANKVAADVSSVWEKLAIPIMRKDKILLKVLRLFEKYTVLLKDFNRKSDLRQRNFQLKKEMFRRVCIFDIAYCKCVAGSRCTCNLAMKVPQIQKTFLDDQRKERVLNWTLKRL